MFKPFAVFILCALLILKSEAQSAIGIASGFSVDVNNTAEHYYHIPLSLEWMPSSNTHGLIFQFNYDIPFAYTGSDSAYTLNPSLPSAIKLQKNIRPTIISGSIGGRIFLYKNKRNNALCLDMMGGLANQIFNVEYKNYDKANYDILNPDVNLNVTSLFVSTSLVYQIPAKTGNLVIKLNVQTPPWVTRGKYPLSYELCAPLQLTFGYDFFYGKKRK